MWVKAAPMMILMTLVMTLPTAVVGYLENVFSTESYSFALVTKIQNSNIINKVNYCQLALLIFSWK